MHGQHRSQMKKVFNELLQKVGEKLKSPLNSGTNTPSRSRANSVARGSSYEMWSQHEHDEYNQMVIETLEANLAASGFMSEFSHAPKPPRQNKKTIVPLNSGV
jgi:hypothetical protein